MQLLSRKSWGAQAAKRINRHPVTADLGMGVKEVFLHHSATGQGPFREKLRAIQNYHLNHPTIPYVDIAYNAAASNLEALTADCRGPELQGGATFGMNSTSLSICAIGNFEEDQPSQILVSNIVGLLRYWIDKGWVDKDFHLRPHSDAPGKENATLCCGKYLKPLIPGIERQAKTTPVEAGGLEEIETQALKLVALVREARR